MAQFAEIIRNNCSLISILLEFTDLKVIQNLFELSPDSYWITHYHFGKTSKKPHSQIGKSTFQSICINSFIPLLLAYSEVHQQPKYAEKAYRWLFEMEAEVNWYTRIFTQNNLIVNHAHDSQACIHWYKNYCQAKKCMECSVGKHILL